MNRSTLRRITAFAAALLLVLQTLSVACAVPTTLIHESDTVSVTLTKGESKYFVFYPLRTAKITIYSSGAYDTVCYIYEDESQLGGKTNKDKLNNCIATDDEGGENSNFKLSYEFHEGETYYIEVLFSEGDTVGTFSVTLGDMHVCADTDKNGKCDICGKDFACEHKRTQTSGEKAADCVNTGYTGDKVCLDCGKTLEQGKALAALGHDSTDWITVSEATPEKEGVQEKRCKRCDAVIDTKTVTHTHEYELVKTVKPTCTEDGYTEYKCKTCSNVKTQDEIKAKGHIEQTTQTSATCTKEGSKKTVCTVCAQVLLEEKYAALGHDFTAVQTIREATCTQDGEMAVVCKNCGEPNGEKTAIKANGHSVSAWTIVKEPTCTQKGEKSAQCSVCGEKLTEISDAYGHTFSEWETEKIASCTQTGVRTRSCTVCGEKEKEEISFSHSFSEWEVTKEASCTEKGERTRKCTLCGAEEKEITEHGHLYGEWTSIQPTCTEEGVMTRTCSLCGNTERQTAEALGHEYGEWIVMQEASCVQTGEEKRVCCRCAGEEVRTVEMMQHSFGEWESKEIPTCTVNGVNERKCNGCGLVERVILPVNEHTADKTETVKASVKSDGSVIQCCSVCGARLSKKTISKIDPSTVALSEKNFVCDGKSHKPSLTIKDTKGNVLKAGEDYTVSGLKSQKNTGTYTVTVKFKGNYEGSKSMKFYIKPDKVSSLSYSSNNSSVKLSWKAVKGATGYRVFKYNPKTKKYEKVADTDKTSYKVSKLEQSTKYYFTVQSYAKNADKSVSWADGQVKVTAYTTPSAPTVKLKSSQEGKITVKMSKQSGIKGYEIYVKTGKDGAYKKAATTADTTKVVKAKSGQTCFVKVRAYRSVNGERIYSAYSSTQTVKVK